MTTAEEETPSSDDGKQPTMIHRHPWRLPVFVILGFALAACIAVGGTSEAIPSNPAVAKSGLPEDRKLAPLRESSDCLSIQCLGALQRYGDSCDLPYDSGYYDNIDVSDYDRYYDPSLCMMDLVRYYYGCYNCPEDEWWCRLPDDLEDSVDSSGVLTVDLLAEGCFLGLYDVDFLYSELPMYPFPDRGAVDECHDVESTSGVVLKDIAHSCELPTQAEIEYYGSDGSDCLSTSCLNAVIDYGDNCDDRSDTDYYDPSLCMIDLLRYDNGCYNCHGDPSCNLPDNLMDIVDSYGYLTVHILAESCYLRQGDHDDPRCIDVESTSLLGQIAQSCELPTQAEIESSEDGGSNDEDEGDGGSEGCWCWGWGLCWGCGSAGNSTGVGRPPPVVPPPVVPVRPLPPGSGRPVVPVGPPPGRGSSF